MHGDRTGRDAQGQGRSEGRGGRDHQQDRGGHLEDAGQQAEPLAQPDRRRDRPCSVCRGASGPRLPGTRAPTGPGTSRPSMSAISGSIAAAGDRSCPVPPGIDGGVGRAEPDRRAVEPGDLARRDEALDPGALGREGARGPPVEDEVDLAPFPELVGEDLVRVTVDPVGRGQDQGRLRLGMRVVESADGPGEGRASPRHGGEAHHDAGRGLGAHGRSPLGGPVAARGAASGHP